MSDLTGPAGGLPALIGSVAGPGAGLPLLQLLQAQLNPIEPLALGGWTALAARQQQRGSQGNSGKAHGPE